MFAIKLTLILLGALLYLVGSTCGWLLITFSLVIHIIKTARPTAAGGR